MTSPTAPTTARMRIGIVQSTPAVQADYVWVLIDGSVVQATFFTGYVPVPGDRVIVTQDGTDWFVLGGRSGYAGNLVVNPSFTGHGPFSLSLPPFNWSQFIASGGGATFSRQGKAGLTAATMLSIGAGDTYLASAAFPVTPGQVLDCSVYGVPIVVSANIAFELRLAWFNSGQTAYPTGIVTADTTVASTTIISAASEYPLTSTATVPAAATYARLVIRTNSAASYDVELHLAGVFR